MPVQEAGEDFLGKWRTMARPSTDLTGCTILAVDDTPANLDVLVDMLQGAGFTISVAMTGEEALQVVSEANPDLILLDVMMPGIDGYETCRRLRAQELTADVPIIFLTARDDPSAIKQGFEAGGDDYVTKPFNEVELLARIRTSLERAALARDLALLREKLERFGEATGQ